MVAVPTPAARCSCSAALLLPLLLLLLLLLLAASSARAADPASNTPLRILAFGDSITEGWVQTKYTKTPYTWRLEELLKQRYPGRQIEIVNGGIGSAGVLDRLNPAWYQHLADAKSSGKPFTHIVFLAGINDVNMFGRKADKPFAAMKDMWAAATQQGSQLLILPPLPISLPASDSHEVQRRKLVGLITSYVQQQRRSGGAAGKQLHLLALENKFGPYQSLPAARRDQLYDDGLHLTISGYVELGEKIFQGLTPLIKA